jgi:hypothetical protein
MLQGEQKLIDNKKKLMDKTFPNVATTTKANTDVVQIKQT